MEFVRVQGCVKDLEPPKDWDPEKDGQCAALPVRVEFHGDRLLRFVSAWKPSASDLAILNTGGVLELSCVGGQPPVRLDAVQYGLNGGLGAPKTVTINEDAHGFGHDEHGVATP